jgi:aldehyde dehydrogenase (NAD+)
MRWNVSRGFSNSGQFCHAPSRILVQRARIEDALSLILAEVKQIRVGDPRDAATTMGPVVNRSQFERVQKYIESGLDEGAAGLRWARSSSGSCNEVTSSGQPYSPMSIRR